MATFLRRTICGIAILLAFAMLVAAQTERGTIRGTITDSTGAVVPGVTVKAINVATGVDASTTTTDAGLYNIPSLRPGVYQVEAERTGFKKLIREKVKVDVAGVVGLDLQLELGEVSQEVTVTEAAPQLKSETSEVSTAIAPKTYNDLPIAVGGGRSPEAFIFLAPGTSGSTFDAHINGSQTLSKEVQLEGLSLSISEVPGDPRVFTMPPDAIQEFSIATSSYSAEFGNTGGGIGRFTVKSGTNEFHGNLYEFLRNDKLDARGFFQARRSINRQNEYGGSIGGPIIKNNTFFFFNLNYFKFRSGPANALASVPTTAFKRGDLSELRNPDGSLIQLYDPNSTRPDGQGGFLRDPFPGNIIPADRISSVSKAILAFVPDPQHPGIVNNYLSLNKSRNDNHNYTVKLDHAFKANHRVSGMWNDAENADNGPVALLPDPVSNTRNGFFFQKNLRLAYDWVISPTLVNHLSAGLNRQNQTLISNQQGGNWPQKLGLRGVPDGAFPAITFSPFIQLGLNQEFFTTISNTLLYSDSLSWVKGKHNLKFGADFRKLQNNFNFPSTSGSFTFDRTGTAFPSAALRAVTGNAFASFLLGYVNSAGFRLSEITTGGRWTYLASYVQDDIKLRPNFTLNAGLRWDLYLPLTDIQDRYSIMDPTVPNPRAGGRPGAYIFAGEGPGRSGRHRLTHAISYNNLGPRLGLAWSPRSKMVVRSAYGISYFPTGALGGGNIRANAQGFEGNPSFISPDLGLTPAFLWDNGFPQNFDRPPFINAGFNVGAGANMWNDNAHEPMYRQDWNFGIQYQLAQNWLLDVGYVGAKSTRLNTGVYNVNQVAPSFLRFGDLLTRPIDAPEVVAAGFTPPYPGFRGSLQQALRPFPQYTGIGVLNSANVGNSTYNSLQVKVEKQFSQGLFFLSSYTWAKTITDASSVLGGFFSTSARDHYNRRVEKALSIFDIPHRLVVAFNYELPIGPGKPVADVGGVAGKIVRGWQINGILNYQSGEPVGVGVNNTLPLFNSRNLPNIVPGVDLKLPTEKFDPAKNLYLNINAFQAPAPFTFGNAPSVLNVRNFPFYNEIFGIMKRTYINEAVNVEFRFEMFNAFNRVRFGGPATNVSEPFNFGKVSSQANSPRQGQFALKINF